MSRRSPNAQRIVPCMPPLLPEEMIQHSGSISNYIGKSCENFIKTYFLDNNINVANPEVDEGKDLIIERTKNQWIRGQVKKVSYTVDYKKNMYGVINSHPTFKFKFQNAAEQGKNNYGPNDVDYFYHVLSTPYRKIIWETPSHLVNLRKDGSFVQNTKIALTSDSWVRNKPKINYRESIVVDYYKPIVYQTYPEFFLREDKPTVEQFFV